MNVFVLVSLALALVLAVVALVHQVRLRRALEKLLRLLFHDGETMKTLSSTALTILASLAVAMAGCNESTEVARVATEAADRQTRQNEQMVRVTDQVAEGSRQLVQADAAARKEIVGVHRDLQAERKTLSEQWNSLEGERQSIAQRSGSADRVDVSAGCPGGRWATLGGGRDRLLLVVAVRPAEDGRQRHGTQ